MFTHEEPVRTPCTNTSPYFTTEGLIEDMGRRGMGIWPNPQLSKGLPTPDLSKVNIGQVLLFVNTFKSRFDILLDLVTEKNGKGAVNSIILVNDGCTYLITRDDKTVTVTLIVEPIMPDAMMYLVLTTPVTEEGVSGWEKWAGPSNFDADQSRLERVVEAQSTIVDSILSLVNEGSTRPSFDHPQYPLIQQFAAHVVMAAYEGRTIPKSGRQMFQNPATPTQQPTFRNNHW